MPPSLTKLTIVSFSLTACLVCLPSAAFADYPVCPTQPTASTPLAPLLATPYASSEDALERMHCLDLALRARRDRRAIFLSQYVRTTVEVSGAIAAGEFRDADWTERYMLAFSNLYRQALDDYEAGRFAQMSPSWRIAFDTSKRGDALVLQELLLGLNAHINGDLPLALQQVRLDPNRDDKHADHNTINGVLKRIVDEQLRLISDLYAPGLQDLQTPVLNIAEDIFYFGMASARANAWNNAVTLWTVRWWPPSRLWQQAFIANQAVIGAYAILSPSLSPTLISILRAVERSEGVWPNP